MTDFPIDDFNEGHSFPGLVPSHVADAPAHPHHRLGDIQNAPAGFQAQRVSARPTSYAPPVPPAAPVVQPAPMAPAPAPVETVRQQPHTSNRHMLPEAARGPYVPSPMNTAPFTPPAPQASPRAPVGTQHEYDPMLTAANPLAKYFRVPGLSIRLPTDGIFLPEGAISFTLSGEVQVYPMRAADELLMKSPDALMSGFAVESLMQSCVPSIKYPRMISTPDLDVLFLAIRAASYGNEMEIEVTCPVCEQESSIMIDLRVLLSQSSMEIPDNAVQLSPEVTAYIRPYDLNNATQISLAAYSEARAVQMSEGDPEAHQKQINESYKRMTDVDIAMTSDCVLQIVVPDGAVTDKKHIRDFMQNIPRDWMKAINDRLKALNGAGLDKTTPVGCAHCHHTWVSKTEFDPSSFFGQDS